MPQICSFCHALNIYTLPSVSRLPLHFHHQHTFPFTLPSSELLLQSAAVFSNVSCPCIFPVSFPQPHVLCGTSQGSNLYPQSSSLGIMVDSPAEPPIQPVLSNVLLCFKHVAKTHKIRCQKNGFFVVSLLFINPSWQIQGAAESVMEGEWMELLIFPLTAMCPLLLIWRPGSPCSPWRH